MSKFIRLSECCSFYSGGTPTKESREFWKGNIPWFSPKDIKSFELTFSQDHINKDAVKKSAARLVDHGTILVVSRSGVLVHTLPVGIIQQQSAFNQDIRAIIPNKHFDPEYIALFLKAIEPMVLREGVKVGATVHSLKSGYLEQLEIPKIELSEQRRITTQLKAQLAEVETARKALDIQERDVKKLETQLLESIFVKLKPEKFVKIGDAAVTTSGSTPSRDKKDYWAPGQYAWIKTGEVAYEPIYDTEESISEKALTECSLTLLPPKTVLVAMYGQGKTRGQSAVLEVPATTNQACFAILPNKTFHPEYLQYWLRHSYSNLRSLSDGRGGNQANLNGAMLKEFTVPLLPMEKQVRLAMTVKNMLDEIDNIKATIQTNKKEIELLSTRLLAQAFDPLSAQ